MVKVSIILPIYNVAPFLDDAFLSLINQTLRDIEIIAINDGSTDNSQDYIDKYAKSDARIRPICQENQGLSGARNTGLKYCQGEFVYFMDSDDIIELDALETCYKHAIDNKADVCILDGKTFHEKDARKTFMTYDRSAFLKENTRYNGEELFSYLLDKERHRAVVWLHFIRLDYLKRINLNFYRGIIHEDELFTPQLILQTNNIFYVSKCLVKHRIRNSSIVGKGYSKRNICCYLTVFDELFKFRNNDIIRKFAKYTLSKVFYTGHAIPIKDKFEVFGRAMKSGYLNYIGWKSIMVFWFKK